MFRQRSAHCWIARSICLVALGAMLSGCDLQQSMDASDSFMPHGFCLSWNPQLLSLFIVGNGLVAVSYYSIPAALWTFIRKRSDLAFNWMFRLFAAFIFLCGTTHVMKLWSIWYPVYWAEGVVDLVTGVVSGFTAVLLWPLIPKALAIRSPKEWEEANARLAESLEQRDQAEKAVRESEYWHRSILEKTQDAFIATDADGLITDWNKQSEETFGWQRQEVLGKMLLDMIVPERHREQYKDALQHYRATGESPLLNQIIETDGLHRDGHELPIELSITPLQLDDKVTFFAFLRDITKRRQVQQELAQARDQALEASRFKSEFLANMSHEIRTPMNAVIGMSDLLSRTQLLDEQRDYATIIHSSADALLDLINDILDYSKIEAGKLDLEIIDFDLLSVVEGTAELIAPKAREKNLSIMTFVAPDVPPVVRGDPGRIRQVLLNLISNGIKFTQYGEVVVRTTVQSVGEDRVTLRFSVCDTGIGITPAAMNRLFTPFTQANEAVTRKYGGTGLGLSISKRLVELMGGKLGLASNPGIGSDFWFTVPLEQSQDKIETDDIPTRLSDTRLLVIDGPPGVGEIIQAYAASWGMRCSAVGSIEQALSTMRHEAAVNDAYDLIFVDLALGKDKALELPQIVQSIPELAHSKLLLLSAAPDSDLGSEAMRRGFSAFLMKPVRQSRLFDCMVNILHPTTTTTNDLPAPEAKSITKHMESAPSGSGRLILVAEDNTINQKVALLLLRELGYAAHAVANGQEAVDALQRTNYALVLMDCQMPEMDGFEATRAIRKMEDLTGRRTPIVALTAHAMSFDRDECLSTGMDDYISKPVTAKKLESVLARFLMPKIGASQLEADSAAPEVEGVEPVDIEVVLGTYGAKAGIELLREFYGETTRLLNTFNSASEENNLQCMKKTIHELKGICAAIYATEMTALCRALEAAIEREDSQELQRCKSKLLAAHSKTLAFLKQNDFVEEHNPPKS
ncbi:MAG TPA: response regulator [Oculatellaceae cyanobacterium]